ncbi:hypothetical protein HPB48_022562 [Haemaphysalis longicornis]|uniref:Uncharacterized protein n=1 Tax=Haemaphysalis longicornis TaxID=44386 RepID=A0A9J6G8H3_HAELO|nr:hypothetical protein HPB48_022562 [Haemaphysalis longicornis]
MRIVSHVTNRHHAMKEEDDTYLAQALPYLMMKPREMDQNNVLVWKAHKQAMGLPPHTTTTKLEGLGGHNKVREIIAADLLGIQIADANHPRPETAPRDIRTLMRVAPLPRNMPPEHHAQRRQARVQYLQEKYSVPPCMIRDVAHYASHPATAVSVIDGSGDLS